MSELIVNVAKVAFVASLYAFLFFVARAIRSQVVDEPEKDRSPPAQIPTLIVTAPEEHRRTVEVRRPLVVGRGDTADVTFDDAFASDLHARFDTSDGRLHVEDLGSTNGTFVNGERVDARTSLRTGDAIRVGGTIMEVQ